LAAINIILACIAHAVATSIAEARRKAPSWAGCVHRSVTLLVALDLVIAALLDLACGAAAVAGSRIFIITVLARINNSIAALNDERCEELNALVLRLVIAVNYNRNGRRITGHSSHDMLKRIAGLLCVHVASIAGYACDLPKSLRPPR